jgi:uncharacterized protein
LEIVVSKGLLIDTGPLVALLSASDQHHPSCVAAARTLRGPFLTIWPIVTEAAYLLRNDPDAVATLLDQIQGASILILELSPPDIGGISQILNRYRDQRFDFADAALMHVAERDDIADVFTIDNRHFSVFRKQTGRALRLIPGPAS